MSELLDRVVDLLGYRGDAGFVPANLFASQPSHRHALRLAAELMNVRAAFGLWTGAQGTLLGPKHARFTPLVYLSEVSDAEDAMRVHRSVWSQGLAPYLVAVAPDRLWVCQGFAFSSSRWERHATEVALAPADALLGLRDQSALAPLSAKVMRSSLAWRDEARTADEFVDERLLRSLAELSIAFSTQTQSRRALAPTVINALIARLLYFYFLVDRGFITVERLAEWDLKGISLAADGEWSPEEIRTLFERLDDVFNGSIFPMPKDYVSAYDAEHLNLLRRVLRHAALFPSPPRNWNGRMPPRGRSSWEMWSFYRAIVRQRFSSSRPLPRVSLSSHVLQSSPANSFRGDIATFSRPWQHTWRQTAFVTCALSAAAG